MSARCNYNQVNYNNISINNVQSISFDWSFLFLWLQYSCRTCKIQSNELFSGSRDRFSYVLQEYREPERNIQEYQKWFKYTLFDISLLVFKFTFVIRIHFSKSGVFSIYLSAIVYSINYILKIEKGFQLSVFDASQCNSVA